MKSLLALWAACVSSTVVLSLFMLAATHVPAHAGDRDPRPGAKSDRLYRHALHTMLFAARRAGVRIDTDIDVLLTARGSVYYATVDGFEDLVLLRDASEGADIGVLYVQGAEEVDDGYYVAQAVVDPGDLGSAFVRLINAKGEVLELPAVVSLDPHPEHGPRKELKSVGGGSVLSVCEVDKDGYYFWWDFTGSDVH